MTYCTAAKTAAHPLAEKLRARHLTSQGMTAAAAARQRIKTMEESGLNATYMVRFGLVQGQVCKVEKKQSQKSKSHENPLLGALKQIEERIDAAKTCVPSVREHVKFPVSVAALIVTFAMVLAFAVYSEVLISKATGDISGMQAELTSQSETINALEVSLETKNDLRVIEDLAVNSLGMVKKEQAGLSVAKASTEAWKP